MRCKDGGWDNSLPFCYNTSTREKFDGKHIFFTVCKQIVNSGTIIYSTHVQEKIVLKIVEYWLGMKVTLAFLRAFLMINLDEGFAFKYFEPTSSSTFFLRLTIHPATQPGARATFPFFFTRGFRL